jgi:ankyrin repeat protein
VRANLQAHYAAATGDLVTLSQLRAKAQLLNKPVRDPVPVLAANHSHNVLRPNTLTLSPQISICQDPDGKSPLMYAVQNGQSEVVTLLLKVR